MKGICENVINIIRSIGHRYGSLLSNTSSNMLNVLATSVRKMVVQIEDLINGLLRMNWNDIKTVFQNISQIWNNGWKDLRNQTAIFVASVRDNTNIIKFNMSQLVEYEVETVKNNLNTLVKKTTNNALAATKDLDGFGLRFKGVLIFTV